METHDYPTGNACIKSFSPQLSFRCIPHSQGTRNPGDPQWYSYFPRHTGRPRHVVRMKALVLLLAQPTDTSWQLPPVFRGPCLALHLSAITHYPTSVEKTWLGRGPQAVGCEHWVWSPVYVVSGRLYIDWRQRLFAYTMQISYNCVYRFIRLAINIIRHLILQLGHFLCEIY